MLSATFRKAILLGFLGSLVSYNLLGQGAAVDARLSGTVFDPNDAVVVSAIVTLSNQTTGFSRQVATSAEGSFEFTLIPPGTYALRVEKAGFSVYLQPVIVLAVGQSSSLYPKLELGRLNEVIRVDGDAPTLNTGNANIGSEVSGAQIAELPLNLRNVFNLSLLSSSVNNSIEYQGLT
jgi:Carboxypeptidase regulatory-like domain